MTLPRLRFALIALAGLFLPTLAFADDPQIVSAEARMQGDGGWTISVTLRHPDTGWDHYADGWEVRLPDGTLLGTRTLAHPHVNEQPFTRALSGVAIPQGTTEVIVRAHCNKTGWAEETYTLTLSN